MRKIILVMHTSVDGYVAGPNGEIDWTIVDDAIFEFAHARTDAADTALYGRVTYELMESYWPTAGDKPNASAHNKHHSAWYNSVHKVVLSKTLKEKQLNNTNIISDNVPEQIKALKAQPGKEILMLGSPSVAHLLMHHELIDEYWMFVDPIALGAGIPMWKDLKQKMSLKLVDSHVFASDVVCLHYTPKK